MKSSGQPTSLPVNTYNKVWIVPDKAVVYDMGDTALIGETHLKVMLEEDYLALQKNTLWWWMKMKVRRMN